MIGIAVPLAAAALYALLGSPQALSPGSGAPSAAQARALEQIDAMLAKFATRLEASPGDTEGWIMLGRSYAMQGQYPSAAAAYAEAAKRRPDDAQVLADYAAVLALAHGRKLAGEPEALIARALKADGRNLKALALAGTLAFQRRDYRGAIAHWQRILPLVPEHSALDASVRARIADAENRLRSDSAPNTAASEGLRARR